MPRPSLTVVVYYLLLLVTRFHNDPRLGAVLFQAGVITVTPVKIVGLLAVAAAFLSDRPKDAAPGLPSPQSFLFVVFAILPVVATLAFDHLVAADPVSSLLSLGLMLIATRLLVVSQRRMSMAVRAMVIASACGSIWLYKQHFISHMGRAEGMEGDANYEALTLVMGVPLAIWIARYDVSRWWRLIGLGSALSMGIGVLLTESRAGLIAAAAVGLVAILQSKRKVATTMMVAVLAVLAIWLLPKGAQQRFSHIKLTGSADNGDEESSRVHFELVKAGLRMTEDHPMTGIGMGEFKAVAPRYNPVILQVANRSYIAHNTYVQIAAECGLPTLLFFLLLIAIAFYNLRKTKRLGDDSLRDLANSMQLGLIGFSIAGAAVTAEFVTTFWIIIFFSQNLREIASFAHSRKRPPAGRSREATRAIRSAPPNQAVGNRKRLRANTPATVGL